MTRAFDAPRALIFEAWTDPTRVARWWGPKESTNPVCEMEQGWSQSLDRLAALLAKL
jgi:uncharacterized protein YndB with AHSA1/START domain